MAAAQYSPHRSVERVARTTYSATGLRALVDLAVYSWASARRVRRHALDPSVRDLGAFARACVRALADAEAAEAAHRSSVCPAYPERPNSLLTVTLASTASWAKEAWDESMAT
jgi:hypothetical protein